MKIDYDHASNLHTLEGAASALPSLLDSVKPKSLLDVGCGMGVWLKAALELGISDVYGIDGVEISAEQLLIPHEVFRQQDLTQEWNLNRHFDALLCLEVAEHLDCDFAPQLVANLTRHSDNIYFSAACPGQAGQHHVNCQWPDYWQQLFNNQGFVCSDALRWKIWNDSRIEPWYRQNIFRAQRSPEAGREPRIAAVVNPDMITCVIGEHLDKQIKDVKDGSLSVSSYLTLPFEGIYAKFKRQVDRF
jgi:SAM-dependent methyltransferase